MDYNPLSVPKVVILIAILVAEEHYNVLHLIGLCIQGFNEYTMACMVVWGIFLVDRGADLGLCSFCSKLG